MAQIKFIGLTWQVHQAVNHPPHGQCQPYSLHRWSVCTHLLGCVQAHRTRALPVKRHASTVGLNTPVATRRRSAYEAEVRLHVASAWLRSTGSTSSPLLALSQGACFCLGSGWLIGWPTNEHLPVVPANQSCSVQHLHSPSDGPTVGGWSRCGSLDTGQLSQPSCGLL